MSDAGVEAIAKAYYESGYAAAKLDGLKETQAAKADAWDEGYEFNMRLWEDGSYANPVNPYRAPVNPTEDGENTHE